jgi:hypothetical protein
MAGNVKCQNTGSKCIEALPNIFSQAESDFLFWLWRACRNVRPFVASSWVAKGCRQMISAMYAIPKLLMLVEFAGVVLKPSQAKGASVGLFMRLFSAKDLDCYFNSEQKTVMAKKYIMPFMTVRFRPTADEYFLLLWDLWGHRDSWITIPRKEVS